MLKKRVSVVIFEGGSMAAGVETIMTKVRHALLLDNINKFNKVALVNEIHLVTNFTELASKAKSLGVKTYVNDKNPQQFHFGQEFKKLILGKKLEKVFYMGGAGLPLITIDEIVEICQRLLTEDRVVIANNTMSVDMVAFSPGGILESVSLPNMDNTLGLDLQDALGKEQELAPRSLGIVFDLDTPGDLLILADSPYLGKEAKEVVASLNLDLKRLWEAKKVLTGNYEDIILLGRVGAPIISLLNHNLKCRLRIFSEERGMKSLGRVERGEVSSMMGYFLDRVGIDGFFSYMEQVAACAIIDSRVIFAHRKLSPSVSDRFYSDLGEYDKIKNSFLKEFTKRAVNSPIPILLGGHSLVLGGLWALVEELAKADRAYQ